MKQIGGQIEANTLNLPILETGRQITQQLYYWQYAGQDHVPLAWWPAAQCTISINLHKDSEEAFAPKHFMVQVVAAGKRVFCGWVDINQLVAVNIGSEHYMQLCLYDARVNRCLISLQPIETTVYILPPAEHTD